MCRADPAPSSGLRRQPAGRCGRLLRDRGRRRAPTLRARAQLRL